MQKSMKSGDLRSGKNAWRDCGRGGTQVSIVTTSDWWRERSKRTCGMSKGEEGGVR